MSEGHDLRKRRQALETELGGLRDQRERAFRANDEAVSRLPAGVIEPEVVEMPEFVDEEMAADSDMKDLRHEIGLIERELVHTRQFGVTQHDAAAMSEFADDDVAADSAIVDLRHQIDVIDNKLARNDGVRGAARRVLWWLRK
jgi:hypothetical protein